MGTDETDIDKSYRELDDGYNPEMVTHDVEDVALVPYGIHGIKILLDVRETRPSAALHNAHPYLESHQGFRVLFSELLDGLFCENPHIFINYVAKIQKYFEITK